LHESKRYQALAVPGVGRVDKYGLLFMNWKLPSGAQEAVQVVGFDLDGGMGGPWNIVAGSLEDLRGEDTVMIDELYMKKLGVTHLGQTVEIMNRRARVVGFTRGIRSFTTSPYVFCSFKNAQNYLLLREPETIFFLVRVAAGADVSAVKRALAARLGGVDVYTNLEMARKTEDYWVFQTGAGGSTLLGATLGLIVGIVIVAQTIYAATVDHLREFGTLKAMGAANSHIYRVILAQAGLCGLVGYLLAAAIGVAVASASETRDPLILLTTPVLWGALALALLMCGGASVLSIRKATRIDPAMVFRS
jgi:putative ABC transport system permease protein